MVHVHIRIIIGHIGAIHGITINKHNAMIIINNRSIISVVVFQQYVSTVIGNISTCCSIAINQKFRAIFRLQSNIVGVIFIEYDTGFVARCRNRRAIFWG